MRWMLEAVLGVCLLIAAPPGAWGYPYGAPDSACSDFVPQHGPPAQTTAPPYYVTFQPETYSPGQQVTVTLKGCGTTFKGFLITATQALKSPSASQSVGSFSELANAKKACSDKAGLTHKNRQAKSEIQTTWTAPAQSAGHIVFRVTFVKNTETYWVSVFSGILRDSSLPPPAGDAYLQPTLLHHDCPSGPMMKDSECGTSKGCLSSVDCDDNSYGILVSWKDTAAGGTTQFNVRATTSGAGNGSWVAVGFSNDNQMGSDAVTVCLYDATANTVSVQYGYNTGKSPPELLGSQDLTQTSGSYANGVLSCAFTQPRSAGLNGKRYDLGQDHYMLVAKGQLALTSPFTLQKHLDRASSTRSFDVSQTLDLQMQCDTGNQPTPTPTGKLARDPECGVSKGCFFECGDTTCDFQVTWMDDAPNNVVRFTVSIAHGGNNIYVAIGFSSDDEMGGDAVTACLYTNQMDVQYSYNFGKNSVLQGRNDLTDISGSLTDGILRCSFTQPRSEGLDGKRFDLSKKYTMFVAKGSLAANPLKLTFHGGDYFVSSDKISSTDVKIFGPTSGDKPLIKAHGCLMIIAWVFAASIGIVTARYLKSNWENRTCLSEKVWFQIHRTCMITVVCATIAAFILIFVETDGSWSHIHGETYKKAHPYCGVVVTALAVINPIMALFRPHPGTDNRWIFNWAHWFVGTAAHILGVITIFFGMQLEKANVPDYLTYIMVGFTVWHVVVELLMELAQCLGRRTGYSDLDRREVYEMQSPDSNKPVTSSGADTNFIKFILFALHLFVVTSITAVLVVLVGIGENELEHH